jgi:hypothetical protein
LHGRRRWRCIFVCSVGALGRSILEREGRLLHTTITSTTHSQWALVLSLVLCTSINIFSNGDGHQNERDWRTNEDPVLY